MQRKTSMRGPTMATPALEALSSARTVRRMRETLAWIWRTEATGLPRSSAWTTAPTNSPTLSVGARRAKPSMACLRVMPRPSSWRMTANSATRASSGSLDLSTTWRTAPGKSWPALMARAIRSMA